MVALRLTIRKGTEPGKSLEVRSGQITIGRDEACDLVLRDWKVSRKHALLEIGSEGEAVLRDLKSTNGTFVNGERVSTANLTGGEELRFGDTLVVSALLRGATEGGAAEATPDAGPTEMQ